MVGQKNEKKLEDDTEYHIYMNEKPLDRNDEDMVVNPSILYFGTPVVLISSMDTEGHVNLAPMSSAWALGQNMVLGLSTIGKTFENIKSTGELTLNFPDKRIWKNVELLAPLTGSNPVPESKKALYRYEKNKFEAAHLTALKSHVVRPPMVKECPIRMEAMVRNIHPLADSSIDAASIEVSVVKVHARKYLVRDEHHIDPTIWKPLIYSFRHYYSLDDGYGKTFKDDAV